MKQLIAFISILFLFFVQVNTKNFVEDYCWRDWNGIVPSDALKAGEDKNGKPIYVGQVIFKGKLINGKIYSDKEFLYFDWIWKEHAQVENVKILCSNQPQKFEWIQTSYNKVLSLLDKKLLVPGGVEEYTTYIGRVFCDGEKTVGKVLCDKYECSGLYTTSNGKSHTYKDFEVLYYNPEINSTNICEGSTFPIDVRFTPN